MAAAEPSNPWRYAHMGLEFAGAVIVLALIGLWVDYAWGTGPWGVIVGVLIGGVGGMYLFIKAALRANRQFSYDRYRRQDDSASPAQRPSDDATSADRADTPDTDPQGQEGENREDQHRDGA